ncbi:hypothetical protein [Flaviaesturariibacter amylovorans]|uniref:Uncharacterized protein n=1 Tax=Flaviaesturariibacter amylovorans TaxID=1084520 RepID=A0ABP8HMQ7_9BACT
MADKQYETARNNEQSPAPGFASVNTFNPDEETPLAPQTDQQVAAPQNPEDASPKPRPDTSREG